MRLRILAATMAIVAPIAIGGGTAIAGDGGRWKKVPIRVTVEGEGSVDLLGSACVPGDRCVYLLTTQGFAVVGDFEGTGVGGIVGADNGTFRQVDTFVGKVKECGTGSFVYTTAGTADAATGTTKQVSDIAPGSGTGELVGITGRWVPSADGTAVVGWVRCKVHHSGS